MIQNSIDNTFCKHFLSCVDIFQIKIVISNLVNLHQNLCYLNILNDYLLFFNQFHGSIT